MIVLVGNIPVALILAVTSILAWYNMLFRPWLLHEAHKELA